MNRELEIRKIYGFECNIPLGSVGLSVFDRVRKNWNFKLSQLRTNLKENNMLFSKRIDFSIEQLVKEINGLNKTIEECEDSNTLDSLESIKEELYEILIYKRLFEEYNTIYSKFIPVQDLVSVSYPRSTRIWD